MTVCVSFLWRGRLCGLACAHELAQNGLAVLVVDALRPGEAPASSAAAGLLDSLTPKGRIMWKGAEVKHVRLDPLASTHPNSYAPFG